MVYRGELEYIQSIEPENEARWKNAMGSHLTQWTSALERMFVVEHQAEAMGYCFWQEDKGEAVLASIFVKSQQRQQGLGRLLLDQFMLDAFAAGFAKLTLGGVPADPGRRRVSLLRISQRFAGGIKFERSEGSATGGLLRQGFAVTNTPLKKLTNAGKAARTIHRLTPPSPI